jgi:hypothetical protein
MQGLKCLVRTRQTLQIRGRSRGMINKYYKAGDHNAGLGILVHVSLLGTIDILIYRKNLNLKRTF